MNNALNAKIPFTYASLTRIGGHLQEKDDAPEL
jgi:hypothetical protein